MGKNRWDERKTALLAETYPVETTAYTAGVVGMSETQSRTRLARWALSKWPSPAGWNVPSISKATFMKSHSPKWAGNWA